MAIEPTGEEGPLLHPIPGALNNSLCLERPSTVFDWPEARRTTVMGGLVEAVFALVGLWFIGIPAGAFFCVAFYKRRTVAKNLNSALGARLGLISGALGFVIFALLGSLEMLLWHTAGGLRQEVMRQLEQAAAQYPGQAQQALEYLKSAQGWGLIVALSTIFILLAFLLLSTLGGAVGGALLGKKNR